MVHGKGKHKGTVISDRSGNSRHTEGAKQRCFEVTQQPNAMLDLLYEVGRKVGVASNLDKLIQDITQMTQRALNASASSVLLFDDEEQELYFKTAEGGSKNALREIRISTQSGIAGWVASHGEPLIVNNVTKDSRFNKSVDNTTGFITKSIICAPLAVHRKIIGVIEVLNKLDNTDFTEQDLETLMSVASTAAMAIENTKLQQSVLDAYKSTIKALAAAIDAKDHYTCGHSQRVMEYALLGAKSLSLPQEKLEILEYAGLLHDIGKIGIDDSILSKSESLTNQEWEIMRRHPVIGFEMLKDASFLAEARELVLYHHERYDGSGYPSGLKYADIPIGARLLSVADAFDTMTTDRSYRAGPGVDYAIQELHRCSGTQFCPTAVNALVSGYNMHSTRLPSFGDHATSNLKQHDVFAFQTLASNQGGMGRI